MEPAEIECMKDDCGWAGDRNEAAYTTFDPDSLLCPECGTPITESES